MFACSFACVLAWTSSIYPYLLKECAERATYSVISLSYVCIYRHFEAGGCREVVELRTGELGKRILYMRV